MDAPCYLIRKGGAWYRQKSQGYTSSAIQAGRYTLAEAEAITHPNGPIGPRDGMFYVREDEVVDDDWKAFLALRTALDAEKARADRLQQALADAMNEYDAEKARADAAEARVARLDAELSQFASANHKQANCIHLTAQALVPDFSATCDALPKAAAYVVSRAEAAEAALKTAREALDEIAAKLTLSQVRALPNVSRADLMFLNRCGDFFWGGGNAVKRMQKAGFVKYRKFGMRSVTPLGRAVLAALDGETK